MKIGPGPNRTDVKLIPRTAPGRSNRRARAFSDEIARLRSEGYGYVAIQQALADVGVIVSKSTVQREVARLSRPKPQTVRYLSAGPVHAVREWTTTATAPSLSRSPFQNGRDEAEAFMKSQITNPLFRAKEPR